METVEQRGLAEVDHSDAGVLMVSKEDWSRVVATFDQRDAELRTQLRRRKRRRKELLDVLAFVDSNAAEDFADGVSMAEVGQEIAGSLIANLSPADWCVVLHLAIDNLVRHSIAIANGE